jgi:large subunit ribosomal protein L4
MASIDVYDLNNQVVGTLDLADDVFGVEVNQACFTNRCGITWRDAAAGTHKTKVRHEVSGSGKKLWRQKGTGRARVGSIRSPLWRHGGTVHGPQPRDYSFKLNRKMQLGAVRSALTAKLRDGEIKVVKDLALSSHKTRDFSTALGKLELNGKVLLVDNNQDSNLLLASRNLPGVTLITSREMEPYHLLAHERVVFSEATALKCCEALAGRRSAAAREGEAS